MALIRNPSYNPSDPNSQQYIFSNPETEVINTVTGQTAASAAANFARTQAPTATAVAAPAAPAPLPAPAPAPQIEEIVRNGQRVRREILNPGTPNETINESVIQEPKAPDLSGIKTSAIDALESLGISKVPTAEELSQKALTSPEFQLLQERLGLKTTSSQAETEAKKAQLESQFEADKTDLENKLAAKGLAFSGIRATQVKALVDSLAASKLDLDRKVASQLLDANLDLKEGMLKAAADVIKDAQAGRKEALAALKDIGLTVVGNQVVPTLAAIKEERRVEEFERVQTRLESEATEPAVSEKLRASKIEALAKAGPELNKSKGTDGYVNPNEYLRLRNDYVQVIGDVSEFDEVFSPLLSEDERFNLGVGKIRL